MRAQTSILLSVLSTFQAHVISRTEPSIHSTTLTIDGQQMLEVKVTTKKEQDQVSATNESNANVKGIMSVDLGK